MNAARSSALYGEPLVAHEDDADIGVGSLRYAVWRRWVQAPFQYVPVDDYCSWQVAIAASLIHGSGVERPKLPQPALVPDRLFESGRDPAWRFSRSTSMLAR
jgi:hypothetical protein